MFKSLSWSQFHHRHRFTILWSGSLHQFCLFRALCELKPFLEILNFFLIQEKGFVWETECNLRFHSDLIPLLELNQSNNKLIGNSWERTIFIELQGLCVWSVKANIKCNKMNVAKGIRHSVLGSWYMAYGYVVYVYD